MRDAPHPPLRRGSLRRQVALLVAMILALAVAGRALPLDDLVGALRGLLLERGPLGGVLLVAAAYALGELLLVPGATVSLLAGAALGPWLGSAAVWLGAATSSALAFLLARHLAGGLVGRLADRRPRLGALRTRLAARGWRWVVVLRLFPVVPYAVQNYVAGLSGIPFGAYWLATLVAMVPTVVLYAWAGHTGAEVARAAAGADPLSPGEWLGLLVAAGLAVGLGQLVRRRLRAAAGGGEP